MNLTEYQMSYKGAAGKAFSAHMPAYFAFFWSTRKSEMLFLIVGLMSVITFILLFSAGDVVRAGNLSPELEAALQSAVPTGEIPVIIDLTEKADIGFKDKNKILKRSKTIKALRDKADLTQKHLIDFLEKRNARKIKRLWIINGLAATIRPSLINELRNQPGIKSIGLDGTINIPSIINGDQAPAEWNISAIHAPELWMFGFTGQGIVVANMDTGVDVFHPDLEGRWRGGENSWFNPYAVACAPPVLCSLCDASADIPCDFIGHGTGTMGIMVGGDAGRSSIGVAPGAQWIAVKVFNDSGQATYSSIHQGFQWLLDPDGIPDTDDAPDVVNISWGFDENPNECITEFQADGEVLRAADIAVAYSAGNAGPQQSTSISPANYPRSFAAGAITANNIVAPFSSRGPSACDGSVFPEVVAPGVNIKTSALSNGSSLNYAYVTGTSFSAPHIAGAMALLLSAFPNVSVDELEWALKYSAFDLGSKGVDNFYGYGIIDAFGAYSALNTLNPDITFSQLGFDFGSVETGSRSLPATFTLTNNGADSLQINTASLKGRNANEFLISGDTCTGQVIPTSSSCIIEALFVPLFQGSKDAEIEISFTDQSISPAHLLLSGNSLLCPISFQDVPAGYWAKSYIENLYCDHITNGCSISPPMFCPDDFVFRAQAAAFIIRALYGENFTYPATPYFTDVPGTNQFFKYIQKLRELNITTGCTTIEYCPSNNVTRQATAAFIIRALEGEPAADYCGTSPPFSDVPPVSQFCRYIKRLSELGITTGCTATEYCPRDNVTRAAMAAFLARAFLGMP